MKRVALLSIFIFLVSLCANAQSVDELNKQVKRYEAEIAQLNRLIQSNNKQQTTTSQNQRLISQKIANRKKIISNLDQQIKIIEEQLGEEGTKIVHLSGQLSKLKSDYNELIRTAYLYHKSNNFYTFLGSDNLYYKSMRNLVNTEKVTIALRSRANYIDSLQRGIKDQMLTLTEQQAKIAGLVKDKGNEIAKLEKEKQQLSVLSTQLKGKSAELSQKENESRKRLQDLQNQITAAIEKDSKASQPEAFTAANMVLSSEFEYNAGKLPLPVNGGVIVDRFGVHDHPTMAGIKINNNGVNFACQGGSNVKAIFGGEVKGVFAVSSMGSCVIVRHGKFLTVYSNLGTVNVKVGEKVSGGQQLGVVASPQNIFHFEIWNETKVLDPEKWLDI